MWLLGDDVVPHVTDMEATVNKQKEMISQKLVTLFRLIT